MSAARLFGKLPAHGDFVARGWRHDERDTLDAWLSASLAQARTVHGADFEARFDSAPPWQHVGLGLAGALAASQDAAGRRFPLFLALAGAPGEAGAEACEALLYAAIGEGWTAHRLIAEANAVPVSDKGDVFVRWWTAGGNGFPPAERSAARPSDLIATMLTTS